MQDIKTYLSAIPVLSTLWFGSFISRCLIIPIFFILVID